MKHLTAHLRSIVVLTLVVALAAVTIPQPRPLEAAEGSAPVTVVNTPLPVTLEGTGSISGNVNATQSGTWNVGVTSLPAVQLAAGTTVGISGGTLAADDPAKQAFALNLCASSGETCGPPSAATVPVGTRYVIETVSGQCDLQPTSGVTTLEGLLLIAQLNGEDHFYFFRDRLIVENNNLGDNFSQETRIYTDGGVPNGVRIALGNLLGGTANASCLVTLSGHLVPMPTPFPTASLAPSNGSVALAK